MRITILVLCFMTAAYGQSTDLKSLNQLEWRSLGPAAMGGRISGIEGVPGNPRLLWRLPLRAQAAFFKKTTNGGVTWQAIFERPETISIGDIAIDPKTPRHSSGLAPAKPMSAIAAFRSAAESTTPTMAAKLGNTAALATP